jgi:hypothetical protein
MFELKALRLSVRATQKEMACQMAMSLGDYRSLERHRRLEPDELRSATFAALRIAIKRDDAADLRPGELFSAFRELFEIFEIAGPARTVH